MQNNDTQTIPTIPASRVAELLASTPGAAHVRALGVIMAPPRADRPHAVGRIVAYVAPPEPMVSQSTTRPINVDVTEAEDALLTFLRTGTVSEPPAADPTYRAEMIAMGATEAELDKQVTQWTQGQADLRRSLRSFLAKTTEDTESKS